MMAARWLSIDEIADHLRIKGTKWIDERLTPGHKIGRLWNFSMQEVDNWVRSGGATVSQLDNETSEPRKRDS